MAKEAKTNAMRLLERSKIAYNPPTNTRTRRAKPWTASPSPG